MATLREVMIADVSRLVLNTDEHAELVMVTEPGKAPRQIRVIIDRDEVLDTQPYSDGQGVLATGRMFVSTVNDTDGMMVPIREALVVQSNGDRWRIKGNVESNTLGGCWLTIARLDQMEKSAQGYRIER